MRARKSVATFRHSRMAPLYESRAHPERFAESERILSASTAAGVPAYDMTLQAQCHAFDTADTDIAEPVLCASQRALSTKEATLVRRVACTPGCLTTAVDTRSCATDASIGYAETYLRGHVEGGGRFRGRTFSAALPKSVTRGCAHVRSDPPTRRAPPTCDAGDPCLPHPPRLASGNPSKSQRLVDAALV